MSRLNESSPRLMRLRSQHPKHEEKQDRAIELVDVLRTPQALIQSLCATFPPSCWTVLTLTDRRRVEDAKTHRWPCSATGKPSPHEKSSLIVLA